MPRLGITIRKWTMLIGRWMGVFFLRAVLLLVCIGVVMMYCRFPRVEAGDQLARAPKLDPSHFKVSPDRALRATHATGAPSEVWINLLDGRPVYRFSFWRRPLLVYADTEESVSSISQEMALRIAAARTGASSIPYTGQKRCMLYWA